MYAPRILLIKADPETHRGLRSRLERRGCEVAEASTQREAVEMAGEMEADLVVQENPVSDPGAPASFDEIMAAIEALVGPLPRCATPLPIRSTPGRASRRPVLAH
jgi:CheY-like chemotaxis protein